MAARFAPKIVLITGCSSGFGLLTAAHLASVGHIVYATMRDRTKENSLISEVNRREGSVNILELDVTRPETIKSALAQIASKHGYLDVLVNNAGYGIGGFFEDLSDGEVRSQMETNFFGVLNVTREAVHLMRHRVGAKIINISSIAGLSASPSFGAYSASKWALEGFSESLHFELKVFGIDVLLIEPGTYKTEIFYRNAKYAKNFDNPQSPYYTLSQHLKKKVIDYVEDSHKDPEEIAILVERLIRKKTPPFRNIPDIESQCRYWLRKILPFRLYRWLMLKLLYEKDLLEKFKK